MKTAVHQLLPSLEKEDAIGNYARFLRDFLRKEGLDSRIFVFHRQRGNVEECIPYLKHRRQSSPRNILIFHMAIGSPLTDYFQKCRDKKILIHHNITPSHFFIGRNHEVAHLTKLARRQLKSLAGRVDVAVADSPYNARELDEMGFPEPAIIPLIFDWNRLGGRVDEVVLNRYRDKMINLIFVGRVAPHKKQEDIIRIYQIYREYFEPDSRLFLVGDNTGFPVYTKALFKLVKKLGLQDVVFTGKVSVEELRAYYRLSRVFISMSEHEGLGVPLVEAMFYRIPIIAFARAAVPETMGKGGLLIMEKRPREIAGLIHRIINDNGLKNRIISAQDQRLDYFKEYPYQEKWREVIQHLLEKPESRRPA